MTFLKLLESKYDPKEFAMGMEVEKEHHKLTHGDVGKTAQIVRDHLDELPDYYTKLRSLEGSLRESGEKYYIWTGSKNCYYTLRYRFEEPRYERDAVGNAFPAGTITRDYHVRNLSTDRDTAIAKAKEITGRDMRADFDVGEIRRRSMEDVDWSIFQAGKYAGQSIHEVSSVDKNYLVWACENLQDHPRYAKTVELAKALVAHELGERQKVRDDEKAEADNRAAAAAPIIQRLDRTYPKHVQTGYHQWEYVGDMRDNFVDGVIDSLKHGQLISERAAQICKEKLIKAETGARRNSKAWNKAMDELDALFDPFIREWTET